MLLEIIRQKNDTFVQRINIHREGKIPVPEDDYISAVHLSPVETEMFKFSRNG